MFRQSSSFDPSVTAIQQHLGAVEQELKKIGRIAGRRGSLAASAATEQVGDTISSVLGDMLERFSWGGNGGAKSCGTLWKRRCRSRLTLQQHGTCLSELRSGSAL